MYDCYLLILHMQNCTMEVKFPECQKHTKTSQDFRNTINTGQESLKEEKQKHSNLQGTN